MNKLRKSSMVVVALAGTLVVNGMLSPVAFAADQDAVARGVKAWTNNCSRCHNVRDPKEMRDDQWKASVFHMRVRAGLTGQETRDILTFLQSAN